MKIQTTIRKKRLVKTIFLLTAILVAALFLGSAVSAGIARTTTTPIEKTQPSGEPLTSAPEATNTRELTSTAFSTQTKAEHDLVIESIDAPASGNAGTVSPVVTITNLGDSDENTIPLNVLIGKRQVTGTIEDFETTNGGYTATGTPMIVWEWGTPTLSAGPSTAHSGVNVWGTDLDANYPSSCNNKLDTASFVVPPYAELTFWHWYDTEASYDGANVKISTDGGTTWTVLTPAGGYTGNANSANPLYPEPIWTGHVQKFWEKESVDLSAYNGQTVKIRFHFGSDGSVNYPGWYIDDVGITSSEWVNEYNQTQNFDIASGETIQVTMPAWTPADINVQENIDIDYLAEAEVTVVDDANPTDNYLDQPFTLHFGYFHDVAITEIVSPADGAAEKKTPEVALANNGQNDESVDVNMVIEKAQYTLYLEEYFEGTFPPTGWTNQIIQNYGWKRNDQTTDARPNYAGGVGFCADADSDDVGSGGTWPMNCALISPSMDLTGIAGAILSYTAAYSDISTGTGTDYADVDISIDGGTSWTTLSHWDEDHSASGPGEDVQVDISSYCGYGNVQIRFHYFAPGWDWYYEVDNVKVYEVDFVPEYNEVVTVDISAGQTTNVIFPDWTPSDITFGFDIDYRVTATAALGGFNTIGTEGFEFYTAGHYSFPSGWTVTPTNPSTWFIYGTGATHTSKCQETGSLNLAQNELLTSPSFNFAGMSAVKLQYSAYFYRAITNGDSYVEVLGSLDGGVSWPQLIKTYTATGGVSYSEDIDISAWAANQPSVTIGYRFVSDADINLTDYFYFDNFWIGNDVSVATESFSSYTAGYYNIPAGWTVTPTNPSTWFVYGTGGTHTSKCQEIGSLNLAQNEFLTSPVFNLGGMAVVKLQYSAYFYRAITNGDSYVEVVGSIDGGVSWPTLIKTYTATGGVSYSEDIDISAWAANQPSVTIGYRFVSDADINLTDYFYFDNFWIGNEVSITTEGFNSYTPGYYNIPAGWTVTPTNPSTWFVYGTGSTHLMKCQETGSLNLAQNEFLTSPVFNLGGMAVVKLQYSAYFYRAITNGDSYVEVVGSIDGGVSWPQLIKTYTATGGVSYSEDIDISAWAANQPSVQIGYRFVSPADVNLTDYFYFDGFWIGNEVPVISEYFNNYVPGYYNFPTGWTTQVTNPTGKWYLYQSGTIVYPKVNESGSNGLAQDEWCISPAFNAAALASVKLKFTKNFYNYTTTGDSKGQVRGSIDGGVTWPYYIVNYSATSSTAENRDISSWAAGQANVKIAFRFISTTGTLLSDYFYFDDFWVGSEGTPVFNENFNSTWGPFGNNPPAGWNITTNEPVPVTWDNNNWHRYQETSYPAQGYDARIYYSPVRAQDDYMITPKIDCSALSNVALRFWTYRSQITPEVGYIYGSIDNGTTWPYTVATITTSYTAVILTYDISSWAASQSQVKIKFRYVGNNGYYWRIDDVKLLPVTTVYSSGFGENYIPANWGPLGWQVAPPGDTHWSVVNSANAGGVAPEARFYYSPSATGNFSLRTGPIDTSAYTALTLSFKEYISHSETPYTLYVDVSTDGITWTPVYSVSPTASLGPRTTVIPLTAANGIGSPTFQFGFRFSGYTYNINYWYIDNVKLGTLVTVYTTTFNENWVLPSWGPLGWQVSPPEDTHWSQSLTANAGGISPELKFSYSPVVTGNLSFYSGPIDTSAYSALTLSFKHYVNHYATPYTLKVETSSDGITWGTVWSISPTASIPATTVIVPLTTADGIGSTTFQMRFTFSGYTNNINYWYIDDVKLGTLVTIYTTTFNENWVPPSWGPLGWQVSPPEDTHWSQSLTAIAGGISPELKFSYSPSVTGNLSFYSGPIDTSAYSELTMSFKHYVSHYTTPYTLKVETSSDGITWGTVWSISPTASIPATTVIVPLTTADGIGSTTFQMRFTFSGNTYNINNWYIDDVKLGTLVTIYTTTFNENWIPTNWGPAGWQQVVVSGSDPDNEWDVVTTSSYPSGVVPHGDLHMAQYDSYYISSGNSCRLYMPNPVDFSSIGTSAIQAKMWMYHDTGYATPPYDRVEVQVSLDGITWITVGSVDRYAPVAHWEEHTFDLSAYASETTVTIGFLGISQYGNSIYLDDLSLEYFGVISDGNPNDNEMVNWITLTYTHDTGVTEITQPTGPDGNWPPGTYPVAGIIKNLGSFTEYGVPVNAKIWKVGGNADVLFYEQNVTVPILAVDGTAAVTFPDVTFENSDEGNFRLEMKTMLVGDDHPNNDKMTKTFIIQAPDTTPPVTTSELTGTMGQNNWYVSNVTVTLSATDPAGKTLKGEGDGKWPTGVNHTYYKIDSGAYAEYTVPVVVTGDGQHTVSYYSDDKAGNVETAKSVSFKMDTTAPEWINYTFTPLNLLQTKWLCVANVEDATSGIVLVEFYVDDALVGNVTIAPYEFEFHGKPTNSSQGIAYDAAGNSALSQKAKSYEYGSQQQSYPQVVQTLKLKNI